MSARRLAPGKGKSPRIYVPVTDAQRQALRDISSKTGRTTAQLTRDALDAWLAAQGEQEEQEEMPQAS